MRRRMPFALWVLAGLLVTSGGCRKPRQRILTKAQMRIIEENVLTKPPTPAIPIGADFGGKIRLLGVDLQPKAARPGDEVTITWYWEAVAPPHDGDWMVFVHLDQPGRRQNLDHIPVEELYPIKDWQAGQIVRDRQRFRLDKSFKPGPATFWVGIYDAEAWRERRQSDRLPVRDPGKARTDGDNRLRAAVLQVLPARGRKPAAPARLPAARFDAPITVDGKLDEPVWKKAREVALLRRPDGKPGDRAIRTTVRAGWDDAHLYFGFEVQDPDVRSPYSKRDDTLWKADVVEVYLDPGADGRDYAEIQVAPSGAVFDALFASHRKPDWPKAAKRDLGVRAAVQVHGTLNGDGPDKGWTAELVVPIASLPGAAAGRPPSGKWRINLYRIDSRAPSSLSSMLAWAPAGGDFHNLSEAGFIQFLGASQQATPSPNGASPAASPKPSPASGSKP